MVHLYKKVSNNYTTDTVLPQNSSIKGLYVKYNLTLLQIFIISLYLARTI